MKQTTAFFFKQARLKVLISPRFIRGILHVLTDNSIFDALLEGEARQILELMDHTAI